jgi:vancomycin resistance protein YoaR
MITTTETLPATTERRPSARLRFGVTFLIGLIAALAVGAGALYAYDQQYVGRILPGVQVGGVDLAGMTPDAARAELAGAFGSLADGKIVITGPAGDEVITYAEIGRKLDADALVAEALAIGRSGSAVDRVVADARTAFRGVTLMPRVTFDTEALVKRIAAIADSSHVEPAEASVVADDKLAFHLVTGHAGRTIDPTETISTVALAVAALDAPAEVTASLPATTVEPTVSTAEAFNAKAEAERIAAKITLKLGERSVPIDTAKLRKLITFTTTADGDYQAVLDTAQVPTLLDGLAAKVDLKPINASFRTRGSKIVGVTASKNGYKLDVATTTSQIQALLTARIAGATTATLEPAVEATKPALTTAGAEAAIPKMRRISTWTTYFPITEKNGFGANIWIPALTIDGYVVAPRDTFDFWKAVGPVSRAKGYKQGGAIINGRSEPQGALAGGICSCSTTLFNAALRAGFPMGARRNHYYYIDRYPLGLDATVFISASGSTQTMSWTNDTDYPVLIRGYKIRQGNRGYVKFELYSVPTGRKVIIGAPTVRNVRYASDTVQLTSSLAPGARKRIEYPVDGKQVWRTVTVKDAKGNVLHSVTYYSNYSRVTGITLVGRSSATTTADTTGTTTP